MKHVTNSSKINEMGGALLTVQNATRGSKMLLAVKVLTHALTFIDCFHEDVSLVNLTNSGVIKCNMSTKFRESMVHYLMGKIP